MLCGVSFEITVFDWRFTSLLILHNQRVTKFESFLADINTIDVNRTDIDRRKDAQTRGVVVPLFWQ